jgi:ribulose-phosphate 3-epimerase
MRELAYAREEPVQVEVDGGVATATIVAVQRAGANILVAGSAVFSQPNPGDAFRALGAAVSAPSGV